MTEIRDALGSMAARRTRALPPVENIIDRPVASARPRTRLTALIVGIAAAALTGAALYGLAGAGASSPVDDRGNSGVASGDSEPDEELTGDAYAEHLGLQRHPYDPETMDLEQGQEGLMLDGRPLAGCETPTNGDAFAFHIMLDGGIYCFSAPTELEVWVISERLAGHVPTDEEIAQQEAEFRSD